MTEFKIYYSKSQDSLIYAYDNKNVANKQENEPAMEWRIMRYMMDDSFVKELAKEGFSICVELKIKQGLADSIITAANKSKNKLYKWLTVKNKTIETILDNAQTDRDVTDLYIQLMDADYTKLATWDNFNDNFKTSKLKSKGTTDILTQIFNGMVNEIKRLEAENKELKKDNEIK